MSVFQIQATSDTVWVNAPDGSTVGRFSKRFGVDVHRTADKQMRGQSPCICCTHGKAGDAEWKQFRALMKSVYGVHIRGGLLRFKGGVRDVV